MLRNLKLSLTLIIVILTLGNLSFAGILPLNTGYDYSNWGTYPQGAMDDYWIRIASYPPVTPPVGDTWSIPPTWGPPMNGPTGIPSTWINAFGNTSNSTGGVSTGIPGYAIYRKCFCLPGNYGQVGIRGTARADDTIQIWMNSHLNTILSPSPGNFSTTPHNINYSNQSAFKVGSNCIYILTEDIGGATGLNFAANVTASGANPMIAKGINMSYGSCPCSSANGGPATATANDPLVKNRSVLAIEAGTNDDETVKAMVKIAEARRMEKMRSVQPKK